MSEWKRVKLKELIKEVNERNKGEKVKRVLSVTNSRGFVSQEEYFEGTVHSANISNYKIVRKNQFAYNPSRVNVGSIDILKDYEEGALSPMYIVFEVDTTKLLPDYFKYYFQTNRFFENVKNNTQGSVRNSLSFKALSDFDYLLPPIEEQEKIAEILKTMDSISEKYKSLLEEKNQFIKSQFVEMFENDKYEKIELKNVTDIKGRVGWKGYTKADLRSNGPLVLGATHISNDGLIDLSEPVYISEEKYDESPEIMIKTNDLIFAQRGSLGKVGLVNYDLGKATINPCVLIIRPIKINPQFLRFLLIIEYENGNLSRLNSGSTIPMISQKTIGNYRIINPNIQEQNKFASFVELIDKQKFLLEKQKQNYENLKKALMQQLLTGKVRVKI